MCNIQKTRTVKAFDTCWAWVRKKVYRDKDGCKPHYQPWLKLRYLNSRRGLSADLKCICPLIDLAATPPQHFLPAVVEIPGDVYCMLKAQNETQRISENSSGQLFKSRSGLTALMQLVMLWGGWSCTWLLRRLNLTIVKSLIKTLGSMNYYMIVFSEKRTFFLR